MFLINRQWELIWQTLIISRKSSLNGYLQIHEYSLFESSLSVLTESWNNKLHLEYSRFVPLWKPCERIPKFHNLYLSKKSAKHEPSHNYDAARFGLVRHHRRNRWGSKGTWGHSHHTQSYVHHHRQLFHHPGQVHNGDAIHRQVLVTWRRLITSWGPTRVATGKFPNQVVDL